ncbi:formimidoylglutamase [Fervidibacillus halotolerans]|uniref:Formimidoylglutamase n=1 Tax=Fervidibacillus halotolerans TaxID=2980027 RepID=A0A9E8M1H4_9BACI|nr:formimidoylglutamase [Fervidibacillus halotolerans]WAA13160.1 formimidoylglutamase [Fervidibacillus halotolerans]
MVQCFSLEQFPPQERDGKTKIGILGFESDEGVRRNQGRVGAKQAPDEIRKFFAQIPVPNTPLSLFDLGNIACEKDRLEAAQHELGKTIQHLLQRDVFPLILGGGHETAYGHYLGVRSFLGDAPTIGIINIDAHFDLREGKKPSSGTMFRQILEEDGKVDYFVLGIQRFGNTEKLFQTAEKYNCKYLLEEEVDHFDVTFEKIQQFANRHDYVFLTLCFDAIDSSYAPGVSAPSPFGLHPKTVRKLLRMIARLPNLLSFDISEVNPVTDESGKTAKLASLLIADFIHNRST